MEILQIKKENALKAYNNACSDAKKVLENLLGKETFVPANIMDRINSFSDIVVLAGEDPSDYVQGSDESDDEFAYRQAKLIAYVYNGNKIPDASNTDLYKYFPWHRIVKDKSKPSGFGLSYDGCDGWRTLSVVGVRLCFENSDHAVDAGKKFIEIYERLKIR